MCEKSHSLGPFLCRIHTDPWGRTINDLGEGVGHKWGKNKKKPTKIAIGK